MREGRGCGREGMREGRGEEGRGRLAHSSTRKRDLSDKSDVSGSAPGCEFVHFYTTLGMEAAALHADLEATPLLDQGQLEEIAGIPGLLAEVHKLVQEKGGAMAGMRAACEGWGPEELKAFSFLAHSMKSGICMVGGARLALLCHKLGE
jgi:hypothetical protein